ncbi:MAG: chloride channel protein [Gemmataceae bacterium]
MSESTRSPAPSNPLRWFPEFLELGRKRLKPQAKLLGLSMVVGVIAGVGAIVFYIACGLVVNFALERLVGYHPPGPKGESEVMEHTEHDFVPYMLLIVPTVGGLISGFIVYTFAPEAEGHGTDAAIAAYHHQGGRIRPRVPLIKIITSAVTIGTGGSGGREGPIAQIGAGFGSYLGTILNLRPQERRILMAAGMGAGVAAIFRAPLAGALFASEVLYRSPDFESEVIMPAALACISSYCTFGLAYGYEPLFAMPQEMKNLLVFREPLRLFSYLLLAVFMAVLAMIYTRSFYGITHLFFRLRIKPHFKPAIGAFLSGLVGFGLYYAFDSNEEVLSVLSFGYGVLQNAMTTLTASEPDLRMALILLAIALGKILTTGLTIGSGGSGGVFGPSMVIGGCGGGALGIFLHWLWPSLAPHPSSFVIVGMAGFFAAAAKTPFSTLVIVSELTGNYNLLLPTLWVCSVAFLLSDERSIYSSQVESRSRSPAHQGDYVREVLAGLRVNQFLAPQQDFPLIHPWQRLKDVVDQLNDTSYHVLPVLDGENRLLGVISLEEVLLVSQSPNLGPLVVAADMMRTVRAVRPDHSLDRALELFVENDLPELPVIRGKKDPYVIGLVRRADLSATYLKHVHGAMKQEEQDYVV